MEVDAPRTFTSEEVMAHDADASSDKQRRKPGRKQTNVKPIDKRTAQNRIAQRAFRERKQNYVKELEQKVEELTAIISSNPVLVSNNELRTLTHRVAELEAENASFKRQVEISLEPKAQTPPAPPSSFTQPETAADCTMCIVQKMKVQHYSTQNQAMKLKIGELQAELHCLRTSLQMQQQMNAILTDTSFGFINGGIAPAPAVFQPTSLLPVNTFELIQSASTTTPSNAAIDQLAQNNPVNSTVVTFANGLSSDEQIPSTDEMEFMYTQIHNYSSPFTSGASSHSDDWYDVAKNERLVPAAELFGPIQVESQRFALKSLHSISDSKYIDELMDILITLSKCSSKKANRKLIMQMATVKNKLTDSANIVDRQRILEIFEEFRAKHLQHMNHFYQNVLIGRPEINANTPLSDVQIEILTTLKPFMESAKAIPSLKGSPDLIDDLCLQFSTQSLCKTRDEREDAHIYTLGVMGQILAKCHRDEDRTNFMLALEVARERTRKYSEQFEGIK